MSTLQYTATTGVSRIPLGRRIGEILNEKGEAFSIRKFAEHIGMNRETLRIMIAGGRLIQPSQLEAIAEGLGLSVDRLKQADTYKIERELFTLLQARRQTKVMLMHASTLADSLVKSAVGATERAISLNYYGKVCFLQSRYNEAHEAWSLALEYAEEIMKLYGDGDQLHLITSNLMLTYTIRREYSDIERMLAVVEEALADFPEAMGLAYYTRMKVCEDRGEIEEAKKYAYLSLEQFEQTNDEQIGKALINTAHFEFLTKNYKKAAELLLTAIDKLIMHDYFMLIAVKEYVKTLVRLKEYEAASSLIEKHLPPAQDYPELHGKLQLLYSIAKETPEYAIKVCENDQLDKEVRYMASKYLTSYYSVKDDSDSVLKYYKLGRMLSNNRNEFHEGDL